MVLSRLKSREIPWYLILIFFLLSLGIGIAGYVYYQDQEEIIKKKKEDELSAIAELKSKQISGWRKERFGDAMVILENPLIAPRVQQWLKNEAASELKRKILTWMESLHKHYGYKRIFLLNREGVIRLMVPAGNEPVGTIAHGLALEAIRKGECVLSDIHRGEIGDIQLDLLVPLLVWQRKESLTAGVLLLRVDPEHFLFPLIQTWPAVSPTGETLLVRREGNDILYLNELRHRKGTALSLRFPITQEHLPAAMVVKGMEGIVEGVDYRKVPVLAAIRKIPESPWFIVSKVDKEEIYELLRYRARFIMLMVFGSIAAAGIIVILYWRKQHAEFTLQQYEAELEKMALTRHYEYLTKYANDIILLLDLEGRILEANERAVASYGYTPDELLRLNVKDLRSPEMRADFDVQVKLAEELDGAVFETIHQRKDGTTFPVEVSARFIEVEGRRFNQNIIRDITERRQAVEALRRAHDELEIRIQERTAELARTNEELQMEIAQRKRAEEQISRHNALLAGINRVFQEALTSENDAEVAQRCLVVAEMLTGSKFGFIQEINQAGRVDAIALSDSVWSASRMPPSQAKFLLKNMEVRGILASVIGEGKSVIINDPASRLDWVGVPEGPLPLTCFLGVPLKHREKTVGMIGLGNKESGYQMADQQDIEILSAAFMEAFMHKRAETLIKKLNLDLGRRASELQATNKELEAFSYSVSHDLRAPLRSINGFSQAILEDYGNTLDTQGKDYLRRVKAASERMEQLIDDMLNLAQVTRSEMRREEVNLSEMVRKIAGEFKERQPDRPVEFVIMPGLLANGDGRLLHLALGNLLDNAWKFTGKHPRARIEFGVIEDEGKRQEAIDSRQKAEGSRQKAESSRQKAEGRGQQVFYVRDDGVGFDMAYADKLFIPFQRLHALADFTGTGIGLAIVRRVIHKHGGRVWAEGEVEKGATFYFTIP